MNYESHKEVIKALSRDQDADSDNRKRIAREMRMLYEDGGQWEDNMWQAFDGRPRYTFDQLWPNINKAWAEMASNEYAATTSAVSGGAGKENAKTIDGLFRAIYNISSFDDLSTRAGKRMMGVGEAHVRVVSTHIGDSFYQDMKVIALTDSHNRVWWDCSSILQTREDANHCNVLTEIYIDECKKRWPKRGSFKGVDQDKCSESSSGRPSDTLAIGEVIYKKQIKKTIFLMNDGEGTVLDEEELGKRGIGADSDQVLDSRVADSFEVWSRKYDNDDWLEPAKKSAFKFINVIPFYANFDIVDGKVHYSGMVKPIADACMVLNYIESRKVEDSVLGIPEMLMATKEQVGADGVKWGNLNRRSQRSFDYNHKDGQIQPYKIPASQPSAALSELSMNMQSNIQLSTGMTNPLQDAKMSGGDSDMRYTDRSVMGQMGTYEYYRSYGVGLEHLAKVMLSGLSTIYDAKRIITIIDESNKSSDVTINDVDGEGNPLNDLTIGKYDIVMNIGPSSKTRAAEANSALIEAGQIVPGLIERNTDILIANVDAPGMNMVSERERSALFKAGVIPQEQWTDTEKEQMEAAAQQPKEQTPEDKIGEAELRKAENQAMKSQYEAMAMQAKLELQQSNDEFNKALRSMEMQMKEQSQDYQNLKLLTDSLVNIVKASGADAVVSPGLGESISNQTQLTIDQQRDIDQNN